MLTRRTSKEDPSSTSHTLSSQSKRQMNPNKESSQVLRMSSQITHNQNAGPSVQLKWRDELTQISESAPSERSCDSWLKDKMGMLSKQKHEPHAGGPARDDQQGIPTTPAYQELSTFHE